MLKAKIFKSGNSQAIRLPKEYRLDADTVHLNKIGNLLMLVPLDDPWANFIDGIKEAVEFPDIKTDDLPLNQVNIP